MAHANKQNETLVKHENLQDFLIEFLVFYRFETEQNTLLTDQDIRVALLTIHLTMI